MELLILILVTLFFTVILTFEDTSVITKSILISAFVGISFVLLIWISVTEYQYEYLTVHKIEDTSSGEFIQYYEYDGERYLIDPKYSDNIKVQVEIPRKLSLNSKSFEIVTKSK